jgi:hypothetical protein
MVENSTFTIGSGGQIILTTPTGKVYYKKYDYTCPEGKRCFLEINNDGLFSYQEDLNGDPASKVQLYYYNGINSVKSNIVSNPTNVYDTVEKLYNSSTV